MDTVEQVIEALQMAKAELANRFKVQEIGIFGSMARGEQRQESDIDIVVDLDKDADLLDLIGLSQYLEERLRQKVDVVPKAALRQEIRERVLREVFYL